MKRFTIIFLSGLAIQYAHAQMRFSSLHETIQFADKNSIVPRQSGLQQNISNKDALINKSGLLPKINLFGTADYFPIIVSQVIPEVIFGGSPDKFRKVQFGLPWSFSSGVELTLPVLNFEKWEQLKRYRLQSQQIGLNGEANLESLHIQVAQSYYRALLFRDLLQLNKDNQQVTDELLRIMDERKKSGQLNPADYNRSKGLQLDMQSTGIEYEKNLDDALLTLRQLLNIPDSTTFELNDSITNKNITGLPDEVTIANRPSFKEAATAVQVAQQQLKESQKASFPKIALNGKYTYQWQMDPGVGQHVNFDYSSVGLRADFPLFQGNYYKNSREKSELQLKLAKESQQQVVNNLTQQQSSWKNNYAAAVKKDILLQQKAAVTMDNLRIARLNIKEGVMEFDEFNNIFLEYNKAKMDYLQNLNDAIVYQLLLTQKW